MEGFTDLITGQARRGFVEVVATLEQHFPDPADIASDKEKKAFIKLFGEYLRTENILQNYDEFTALKALQQVDVNDATALEAFKAEYYLDDEKLAELQRIQLPTERKIQDYRSTYNDIRDWQRRERKARDQDSSTTNWDDIVFEVDLLKSQEINLNYILELIFEQNQKNNDKALLIDEVRSVVRANLNNRAKEGLGVDFIEKTDFSLVQDKPGIIDSFFTYTQQELQRSAENLIREEELNPDAARRYILASLKREYATENGAELNDILPKMSPHNPQYKTKKESVFQKIGHLVEKFKGVGGSI